MSLFDVVCCWILFIFILFFCGGGGNFCFVLLFFNFVFDLSFILFLLSLLLFNNNRAFNLKKIIHIRIDLFFVGFQFFLKKCRSIVLKIILIRQKSCFRLWLSTMHCGCPPCTVVVHHALWLSTMHCGCPPCTVVVHHALGLLICSVIPPHPTPHSPQKAHSCTDRRLFIFYFLNTP